MLPAVSRGRCMLYDIIRIAHKNSLHQELPGKNQDDLAATCRRRNPAEGNMRGARGVASGVADHVDDHAKKLQPAKPSKQTVRGWVPPCGMVAADKIVLVLSLAILGGCFRARFLTYQYTWQRHRRRRGKIVSGHARSVYDRLPKISFRFSICMAPVPFSTFQSRPGDVQNHAGFVGMGGLQGSQHVLTLAVYFVFIGAGSRAPDTRAGELTICWLVTRAFFQSPASRLILRNRELRPPFRFHGIPSKGANGQGLREHTISSMVPIATTICLRPARSSFHDLSDSFTTFDPFLPKLSLDII